MKRLFTLFFCLLLTGSCFVRAQTTSTDKTIHNRQNWFVYTGQFKLNPHWGIHAETQFRMDEEVKFAVQNILRTGLIHYLDAHSNVTASYGYFNTYNGTFNKYATEHRIWEQYLYQHKPGKFALTYRARLEQRWVESLLRETNGEINSGGFHYGNRLRLAGRAIYDLTKDPEAKNVLYLAVQDEVFFNMGAPEINKNFFDQNRIYVGIGLQHLKHTRFEVGYLNQFTNPYNRAHSMNHIAQFSISQTLNSFKEDASR
jgi:hypothetical protein